jgi:hypothetical protein
MDKEHIPCPKCYSTLEKLNGDESIYDEITDEVFSIDELGYTYYCLECNTYCTDDELQPWLERITEELARQLALPL